jgi:protein TonB
MPVRSLIAALALLAAGPAFAQATETQAQRNASNWDIFLKLYPARALAAHEEGAVGFTVTLDAKGDVTDCQVTHSSGHPLLDQETCKLVTLNAVFHPDPALGPSQTKTHEGVINWKLPASTAALPPPTPIAQADGLEKVVCKKSIRTGTLAGVERTCMTQREWTRQSDETKQTWDEVQGRKGSTKGN